MTDVVDPWLVRLTALRVLEAMSLWYCSDCKIPFGRPQPFCPRCGKPGVWQR